MDQKQKEWRKNEEQVKNSEKTERQSKNMIGKTYKNKRKSRYDVFEVILNRWVLVQKP